MHFESVSIFLCIDPNVKYPIANTEDFWIDLGLSISVVYSKVLIKIFQVLKFAEKLTSFLFYSMSLMNQKVNPG